MRCFLSFFLPVVLLCFPLSIDADDHVPKVALVLSGGGARGGAHIGVLRALEHAGVPIGMIVGTSYGALVGGLYSAGYSTEDIERIIVSVNWGEIVSDRPDRRLLNLNRKDFGDHSLIALRLDRLEPQLPQGIFAGQKIQQLLDRLTTHATYQAENDFDRLPVPFRAVATDILTGNPYVFRHGAMSTAIRASIAVPGLFTPVDVGQTQLVDGGIADNLPVDIALAEGADFVIAVDCATPLRTDKDQVQDLLDVLDQAISFRIEEKKIENRRRAHVLIMPDVKDFDSGKFDKAQTLVSVGEKAGEDKVDEIREKLAVLGRVLHPQVKPALLPDLFVSDQWPGLMSHVVIDSVGFEGVLHYSPVHLRNRIRVSLGQSVPIQTIDQAVSALYATGLFETVGYRLLRQDNRTVLVFSVREIGRSELGLGLHYDQDFQLLALSEFVQRQALVQGLDVYARGALGKLKFFEAGLYTRASAMLATRLVANMHWHDMDRPEFQNGSRFDDYQEIRSRATLGLQQLLGNWGSVRLGYRMERVLIRKGLPLIPNVSDNVPGVWADVMVDTRNRGFLPDRGTFFQGIFQWMQRPTDYRRLLVSFAQPIGLSSGVILDLSGFWGYVSHGAPFYDLLHVGGAGHFGFAALRFVGLKRNTLRVSHMASLGGVLRKSLSRSGNGLSVGLIYQAGLYNEIPGDFALREWVHGFGVGAYYNLRFLGPMRFEVVGSDQKTVNFYTSIGHAF